MKLKCLKFPENRVRRNYQGGKGIDLFKGRCGGADGDSPEEWVASTNRASNRGMVNIENEGLSFIEDESGRRHSLLELFEAFPDYYLGNTHYNALGATTGFLMKILDSSMRLHVQAHPNRQFAQQHLKSRWGKLEAYYILAVRPGYEPYIRLGFQRQLSEAQWREIVFTQNIREMDRCFEPVPVAPGDVWLVPGGLPHAIGEGLTVIELMEPTDLVVRCEFERNGLVVPPEARFMGCDPTLAMSVFDLTPYSVSDIIKKYRMTPHVLEKTKSCQVSRLIGPEQADCFELVSASFYQDTIYQKDERCIAGVACAGAGNIIIDNECCEIQRGDSFFIPASIKSLRIIPAENEALEFCFATPGRC